MLLQVTHETLLSYDEPIAESVIELRMTPRQDSDQHRLSFSLAVGPPTVFYSYFDFLGNAVYAFTVNAFHQKLQIRAVSVVEIDRRRPELDAVGDPWPPQAEYDFTLFDYLQFGGPVVAAPALASLAAEAAPNSCDTQIEVAMRMLRMLHSRFTYTKGVTTAASPITDILDHGRGVCQDFTHLMIGLARQLGVPARYVSGFVHPDGEKYRGYTQTHAWCELYFPKSGWIGFDPTNNCMIGPNYVKVAIGRDFRDVPPNRGVYRGSAKEAIEVVVHSEELAAIPPQLAAERFQSLAVPSVNSGSASSPASGMMAQEQQQQQQQ